MIAHQSLESLNDHVLLSRFGVLVQQAHESNANLLRYIDVIDRRQLWAKLGHPSMFAFLVTRHHMSESTAAKRIGAARTARRFPVLLGMVACGEIHLSGIHRLKAHLTPENHEHVLAAAKHKTIRQIEELVARLAPQPDVPSTLRALPTRTQPAPAPMPAPMPEPALASEPELAPASAPPASEPELAPASAPPASEPALAPASAPPASEPALAPASAPPASEPELASASAPPAPEPELAPACAGPALAPEPAPALPVPPARPGPIEPPALSSFLPAPGRRRAPDPAPLAPGRYRLQVTLSQNARDQLKQLQDLLAHQIPNGDPAAIVERAVDTLLTQVHKRKLGSTHKPRARKANSKSTADAAAQPAASGAPQAAVDAAAQQTAATAVQRAADAAAQPAANAAAQRTEDTAASPTRYLEVAVRREVWTRDEGRCGFVGDDGHRCNETRGLEFAHIHPWAKGGAHTASNLGLRCIAHNAWEADRDYGASHMASKRKQKPLKLREPIARYTVRSTSHPA